MSKDKVSELVSSESSFSLSRRRWNKSTGRYERYEYSPPAMPFTDEVVVDKSHYSPQLQDVSRFDQLSGRAGTVGSVQHNIVGENEIDIYPAELRNKRLTDVERSLLIEQRSEELRREVNDAARKAVDEALASSDKEDTLQSEPTAQPE